MAEPVDPPRPTRDAPSEDERALALVSRGDRTAFRELAGRYLPFVLGVARRMLRDEAEAEDMAQEAMVRLWRNASGLELGPGGLRPWLRRVVSNLCIDRMRAGRHLTVVDEVPDEPTPAPQLMGLEEADLSQRVDGALRKLPERQRQALTLFHFEGLSQLEVGDALGISDEAVESLLARGRRALKAALKDEWRQLLPDHEGGA
ncbi:MAG: sigma-70 family RNA polymerase sigma factor [Hyphomicrobiaceae bacterium]